jgi:hypothetical protein
MEGLLIKHCPIPRSLLVHVEIVEGCSKLGSTVGSAEALPKCESCAEASLPPDQPNNVDASTVWKLLKQVHLGSCSSAEIAAHVKIIEL